eukprot:m.279369 g.279369  ORF g.279369 m.279369 type:complete len:2344 (-) comp17729_c0_seq13:1260-8291(-)
MGRPTSTKSHVAFLFSSLVLSAGAFLRPTATSLVYLLLLMVLWNCSPSSSVARITHRVTLYTSLAFLVAQGCFQIALGSTSPYARKITSGSAATSALIGFTPLNHVSVAVVFQRVVLDVIVLLGSLLATLLSRSPIRHANDVEDTNWQLQPNTDASLHTSQLGWARWFTSSSLQAWRGLPPLVTMMVICCFTTPSVATIILIAALTWFAYALSHRRAGYFLELYRAASFGVAQVYVLAFTVFQFPQVADRISVDVARVFGLFQLVKYQTYSDPDPFEPHISHRAWSAWLTPIAYVGLYYVSTIPSRQTNYVWNTNSVRLEPTGSDMWRSTENLAADVRNTSTNSRSRHFSSSSDQSASKHSSLVMGWLTELQLSFSMGVVYLRELVLRNVYIVTVVLLMLWALIYPSWCGAVGLLLAGLAVVPSSPSDAFLPVLGYATTLFALMELVCTIYYLWEPKDNDAEWRGVGLHPRSDDARSVHIGVQACLLLWLAFNHRERRVAAVDSLLPPSLMASEAQKDEGSFSYAHTIVRVWEAIKAGIMLLVAVSMRYLFLLTVVIVFVSALEDVNLLNAFYLIILIIFLNFPQVREEYWVLLTTYSLAVILLTYLWAFPGLIRAHASQQVKDLLGLNLDGFDGLWQALRWHAAIFGLSYAQLLAYRSSAGFRTTSHENGNESAEEDEEMLLNSSQTSQSQHGFVERFETVLKLVWPLLTQLALLLVGVLGRVTALRLGFIALLVVYRLLVHLGWRAIGKRYWYLVCVYAAGAFISMYMYQFEQVQSFADDILSKKQQTDLGYEHHSKQIALFKYLSPSVLVLVSSVLQSRLGETLNTLLDAKTCFKYLHQRNWWSQTLLVLLRAGHLHAQKASLFLLYMSVLRPKPEGLDVISLVLLALALAAPSWQGVTSFLILVWIQLFAITKLGYQLVEDSGRIDVSESLLQWLGLRLIGPGAVEAINYVQFEVYVVVLLGIERLLRSIRLWLWNDNQKRYLIDIDLSDNTSFKDQLQDQLSFVINHLVRLMGKNATLIVLLVAIYIKLNAVAAVYLVILVMLGTAPKSSRHRWRIALTLQAVLLIYQYAGVLGFPSKYDYPWQSFAAKSYANKVFLSWLHIPLPEGTQRADRAPVVWYSGQALYVDFVLIFITSLYYRVHKTSPSQLYLDNKTILLGPQNPWWQAFLKACLWIVPFITLLLLLVAAISRRDLACLLYLGFAIHLVRSWFEIVADEKRHRVFFKRIGMVVYSVIAIHVIWTLPAVWIDWTSISHRWLAVVQLFGLRYGQSLQLKETDPRIDVWHGAAGLIWEFLLLIAVVLQLEVLRADDKRWLSRVQQLLQDALERGQTLGSSLLIHIVHIRARELGHAEHSKRLLEMVLERRHAVGKALTDQASAEWFSKSSLKSALDAATKAETTSISSSDQNENGEEDSDNDLEQGGEVPAPTEETSPLVELATPDGLRQRRPVAPEETQTEDITLAKPEAGEPQPDEPKKRWSDKLASVAEWLRYNSMHALYKVNKHSKLLFIHETVQADVSLRTELRRYLATHTEHLVYLMAFVNAMYVSSFLATLFPLVVLLWATISKPFATYNFWRALMNLVGVVIILRYIFRFEFWGQFNAPPPVGDPCEDAYLRQGCLTFARFVGIWRLGDGPGYIRDMIPDILLLFVLAIHCAAMKVLGTSCVTASSLRLSDEDYLKLEAEGHGDIADAIKKEYEAIHLSNDDVDEIPVTERVSDDGDENSDADEPLNLRRLSSSSERSDDSGQNEDVDSSKPSTWLRVKHFYNHVLNPSTSSPEDYYIASFLLEFTSFLVIMFGWSGFQREDEYSTTGIQVDHIPGPLLLFLLLQFFMILIDRALYITRSLKLKLIYHYVSVLLVHILVFYSLPATTGRAFRNNPVLITLYLLKAIYFLVSSYQIRSSYPSSVQRNVLTRSATFISWLIFVIYKAIPFMYELRMLLDWSCIPTTLTLPYWHKMEDINGQLYLNRYQILTLARQNRGLGNAQPRMKKILSGGLLFVLLVFVLWFPLLLMSLVNSNAVPNLPTTVDYQLQFDAYEPVFLMDALAPTISIESQDYSELAAKDSSGFVRSFNDNDVQRVLLSPQSKAVWDISPSSRQRLMDVLNDTALSVTATLFWTIKRPVNEGVADTIAGNRQIQLPSDQQLKLLDVLNGNATRIAIDGLLPSVMHLDKLDQAKLGTDLPKALQTFANCSFERSFEGGKEWFTLRQTSPHYATKSDVQPPPTGSDIPRSEWLELITLNDRVIPETFSFVSSYGVVGLYVSIVLVIGKFLRLSVDQVSHRIIFEDMPQVVTLENLCKAIYIAREHEDLTTEEELFELLLQLYRSPEALILWSQPSLLAN